MSTVLPEKILRLLSPEDRASLGRAGMTAEEALAKADVNNERTLQGLIVNLLRLKGIEPLWHRTDKRSAATVGWPDLTFAVEGQAIAYEVKFGSGELRTEQKQMSVRLQSPPNSWRWREIRSVDDALSDLRELGL